MRFTSEIRLSKELLLKHASDVTYMEHYLGVRVTKKLFCSPLRNDSKPTCSFYKNSKGDLIMKDFSGSFSGNFIHVVMEKFHCSYYAALKIIANDFGIQKFSDMPKNPPLIKYSNKKFEEKPETIIQVEIQDMTEPDLEFWKSFGITRKTLAKFKVYSCKSVFLNGNPRLCNDLSFGYFGGIDSLNIERWKIYFPKRRSYRFMGNTKLTYLQGQKQLPRKGEMLVITKSMKDVMCLYEQGISAVAPNSENIIISEEQYTKLSNMFEHIILLIDNDRAGVINANKWKQAFPELTIIFIKRKLSKDISDFMKANPEQAIMACQELRGFTHKVFLPEKSEFFHIFNNGKRQLRSKKRT